MSYGPDFHAAATAGAPNASRSSLLDRLPGSRWLIPGCGLVLLALFGVLYTTDTALYLRILTAVMSQPFPHPFIDWEWIPSAVECWQREVDVYTDNTCYHAFAHGHHNYSPLWLRLTFLPYGDKWVAPFGLGIGALFFVTLAALPPPRRVAGFCVTFLATFSSLTAFAIERGNVDLIMFVLAVAGITCWTGPLRWRLAGYGIFILAGLLKFYPFVLLFLALRERPRVFAGICAATLLVLSAFSLAFQDELRRVGSNLVRGSYFGDMFGSVNLPYGLARIGTEMAKLTDNQTALLSESTIRTWFGGGGLLLLTLMALILAVRLQRRFRLHVALAAMPPREAAFLVGGAILICGCFFAGQNVGYRAILILMTLPGLLRLGRSLPDQAARAVFMVTCWAVVFVMWLLVIQHAISAVHGPTGLVVAHWLMNQLVWWWIIAVLLAVLLSFVLNSEICRVAARLVGLSTIGLAGGRPAYPAARETFERSPAVKQQKVEQNL